jgi:hypothetical protein
MAKDSMPNKIAPRKSERKKIAEKRKYAGEIPLAHPREQLNDVTCRFIRAPPGSETSISTAMSTPPGVSAEKRSAATLP